MCRRAWNEPSPVSLPTGRPATAGQYIEHQEGRVDPLEKLKDEIKNRALVYREIYLQLSAEVGAERASRLMGAGIYERGKDKGDQLRHKIGEPDFERLAQAFIEGKHEMDAFGHEVVEVSDARAVLRLTRCPLVEAWDEAGLSPDERKTMCDIACQVDFGKFEGAGYRLNFKCRIGDGGRTCDMELTK
jgi:hypothetical protein